MAAVELGISNEWGALRRIVVGHARDMGAGPDLETAFDPTSKWHLANGTYPDPMEVEDQLDGWAAQLESEGVEVLRPFNLDGVEQIFARDVGMVIDHRLIRSRTIDERSGEWEGVAPLLPSTQWLDLPKDVQLEGGDVLVLDDVLFVGVTRNPSWSGLKVTRTNPSALDFLRDHFPDREVIGIELLKDDTDPLQCALHLDCAYMPLGRGDALVCPDFFVHQDDVNLLKHRHSRVIEVTAKEASQLQTNLLHLNPDTLFIDPTFHRVAEALKDLGYHLKECPLDRVGRMGGLFRCTTLPLVREA